MDADQLYQLINDNGSLAMLSSDDLQHMIDRYPYFQTLRILALKKMKQEEHLAFERGLKKSAVYIGDRAKLYTYLHPVKAALPSEMDSEEVGISSFSLGNGEDFNYLFLSPEEAVEVNKQEVENVVESLAQQQPIVEGEESAE